MLANTKYVYVLSMWSVEKRPNGWYFSKSAYHGDKHNWRGPYRSEMSVTLMIARELQQEIRKRHAPHSMECPMGNVFDNTQAFREGWGLFMCDGLWRVQRLDDPQSANLNGAPV